MGQPALSPKPRNVGANAGLHLQMSAQSIVGAERLLMRAAYTLSPKPSALSPEPVELRHYVAGSVRGVGVCVQPSIPKPLAVPHVYS